MQIGFLQKWGLGDEIVWLIHTARFDIQHTGEQAASCGCGMSTRSCVKISTTLVVVLVIHGSSWGGTSLEGEGRLPAAGNIGAFLTRNQMIASMRRIGVFEGFTVRCLDFHEIGLH